MNANDKSIYRRGSEWGLPLGMLMIAAFCGMVGSMQWPLLALLAWGCLLAIPVLVYLSLWRTHSDAHGLTSFSALWMQGIVTFFCGTLLASLVGFVFMRWIDPAFLTNVCVSAAEAYEQMDNPTAHQLASDLRLIVSKNLVPSPISVVMGWLWLGVFGGSILSIVVALIVRLRKVPVANN